MTVSLFAVNLAIFVLFCYLCYSTWSGDDEVPQRKSLDPAAEAMLQNEECLNPLNTSQSTVTNKNQVGIPMDKPDGMVELEMDEFAEGVPTSGQDQDSAEHSIQTYV